MQNNNTSQDKKLLAIIASGLQKHAELQTKSQLGDRRSYIGMSDIALMSACQRLATLRKREPKALQEVNLQNYEQILKKQLTLQRGHWLEEGIANALYAQGFQIIPQLEIAVELPDKVPIKIHLDFVLVGENVIRILELKSNEHLPCQAQKTHETQVQGQASFLYKYWNDAVFGIVDAHGTQVYSQKTFPEICNLYLGINLNKRENINLQAWILCVSMSKARTFGPYLPIPTDSFELLAKDLWKQVHSHDEVPHSKAFCMLCSFCEYSSSCSKFVGDTLPEWKIKLDELEKLKILKEQTCEDISALEQEIKLSLFDTEMKNKWITSGKHRFKVSEQQGRKTLNKNLLVNELIAFMDENSIEQLLANAEVESAPSARLYVTNVIS